MATGCGTKRKSSLDSLLEAADYLETQQKVEPPAKKPTLQTLLNPSSESDSSVPCLLTQRHINELVELGYTVVENVVDADVCMARHAALYEEMATRGVNWRDLGVSRSVGPQIHGIVQHLEIGHTRPVWEMRQEERVTRIFERIYGDNDLLVSFDGICLWRLNDKDDGKRWWHVDQSHTKPGLRCIQGSITMADCAGGLAVLPRSHLQHATFSQHFERAATMTDDWFKYEPEEFVRLKQLTGTTPVVLTPPVGSLVLWDSRTAHMAQMAPATAPIQKRQRCVIYLCYQPRSMITGQNLLKKIKAYDEYRMTTHWAASTIKLFPRTWRTWNVPQVAHDPAPEHRTRVETPRMLELAGKTPLKTRKRRLTTPALKFVNRN